MEQVDAAPPDTEDDELTALRERVAAAEQAAYAYGLAIAGVAGVEAVLRNLIAEFDLTMGLAGCRGIAEINRERVIDELLLSR